MGLMLNLKFGEKDTDAFIAARQAECQAQIDAALATFKEAAAKADAVRAEDGKLSVSELSDASSVAVSADTILLHDDTIEMIDAHFGAWSIPLMRNIHVPLLAGNYRAFFFLLPMKESLTDPSPVVMEPVVP